MNEQTMQTTLNALIADAMLTLDLGEDLCEVPEEIANVESVMTFEEAGILTRNKGLVIRMKDRREFQVTIVQSK